MEMTPEKWAVLQAILHPAAYRTVCQQFMEAAEDQPRERDVLKAAIDAQAAVTGITLTFHF